MLSADLRDDDAAVDTAVFAAADVAIVVVAVVVNDISGIDDVDDDDDGDDEAVVDGDNDEMGLSTKDLAAAGSMVLIPHRSTSSTTAATAVGDEFSRLPQVGINLCIQYALYSSSAVAVIIIK